MEETLECHMRIFCGGCTHGNTRACVHTCPRSRNGPIMCWCHTIVCNFLAAASVIIIITWGQILMCCFVCFCLAFCFLC